MKRSLKTVTTDILVTNGGAEKAFGCGENIATPGKLTNNADNAIPRSDGAAISWYSENRMKYNILWFVWFLYNAKIRTGFEGFKF